MKNNYYDVSVPKALEALQTSHDGLSIKEAESRLAADGKNELKSAKKKSAFVRFLSQFKDVMILVLLAAAAVSAVIAITSKVYDELIDSGVILLIVLINAIIGFKQESKAESSMEALKSMNQPYCTVRRDGKLYLLPASDLVVGDIVMLEAGDIVPADLRLIESVSLKVSEAALTGESVPSEKNAGLIISGSVALGDRNNMAFSSGTVAYGRGEGVVTATGMSTEVGKIAQMLTSESSPSTPLQKQLTSTAKLLSLLVLGIAAVIFAVTAIRGGKDALLDSFMTAVAIAVAAIPEGLPAVVTIVLAIGMQRMSERKAIIRSLPAVETLGSCQVICSDKTGTITLNKMTVTSLYTADSKTFAAQVSEVQKHTTGLLIAGMVLCNNTVISETLIGDPTETALVDYAMKAGVDVNELNNLHKRLGENPFDSDRKLMSTLNAYDGGKCGFVKGAVDMLIPKCTHIQDGLKMREITSKDLEEIKKANNEMAKQALRVLAVAVKSGDANLETLEAGLTFVGLVGMIDPARPEVKHAVEVCRQAGLKAIMITGDHIDTASAIAREVGILGDGDIAILGKDLDAMSEKEFLSKLHKIKVYARVSPENKVRIVNAYKSLKIVVAMTGDGANDAPSIKAADIGIGMGITGTDVSKAAADMVLADDNFATIIAAVEEGRKVYSNIIKAVQFLLSANIAEVLSLFVVTVFMRLPFLTPVMILWVNLVTDSLPALSLGLEKAESDVMKHPPRKAGKSLLSGRTGKDILIQGTMQSLLVLLVFATAHFGLSEAGKAVTMAFVTLCMIQLFHAFNLRSQHNSLFTSNPLSNKFLNWSTLIGTALVVAVVALPFLNNIFDTVQLSLQEWFISIGIAFLIIPLVEIQKLIEGKIFKDN